MRRRHGFRSGCRSRWPSWNRRCNRSSNRAPRPLAGRLELIRRVRAAGLSCGVLVAPILPHLTDTTEHLEQLVSELAAAGATSIGGVVLHLRPGAREWFFTWLSRSRPDLVPAYERLYGSWRQRAGPVPSRGASTVASHPRPDFHSTEPPSTAGSHPPGPASPTRRARPAPPDSQGLLPAPLTNRRPVTSSAVWAACRGATAQRGRDADAGAAFPRQVADARLGLRCPPCGD